ncbi:ABC transporter permease [Deltaproteobacteria bacterium TL4]
MVAFKTLFLKECQRFMKVAGQTLVSPLISSSLYLMIFGVNLSDKISLQNGVNYLEFIIPGLMGMGVLNNAFQNATSSITISKFHGDLQDLKVAPLSPSQIVWAYALAACVRGIVVGLAIAGVGQGFYVMAYAHLLSFQHWVLLLFFMVFSGLTFGLLGLSVALYATSFEQVNAVGMFIILPLIYLGGVFFSILNMHPFWQTLSYMNPLLYLVNGIRFAVLGTSDIPVSTTFPLSLLFVILAYFLAQYAVRRGNYSKF